MAEEEMDVIFDDEEDSSQEEDFEDPLFIEEEDSDRVIWDENGLNEDFNREEVLKDVS